MARSIYLLTIACALILVSLLSVRHQLQDPDTWWHLKTGQIIVGSGSIPHVDQFSFTAAGKTWIPHEWLPEVTIYAAYAWAGLGGLMGWLWLATAALYVFSYLLCAAYSRHPGWAILGAGLTWLFSTVGLAVRPHMVGYLCLILELIVLTFGMRRRPRLFLLLVPLFAVWVNSHASFLLGLLIAFALLICSWLPPLGQPLPRYSLSALTRRWLGLSLVLSVAALFCNPTGWSQIWYPVDTMFNQPDNLRFVEEWSPLSLGSGLARCALLELLSIVVLLAWRRARLYTYELVWVVLAFYLAASHARMLFVFAILVGPVWCRVLAQSFPRPEPAPSKLISAIVGASSLLLAGLAFPSTAELERQLEVHNPVKAIAWLREHPVNGRMLNDYSFGGYLIWAMPEKKVFIDGRADLYTWAGILPRFTRWAKLNEDPQLLLDRYAISSCLLQKQSHVARVLTASKWKIVYEDQIAVILSAK